MKRSMKFLSILIIFFPTQMIFPQSVEVIRAEVIKAHGGEERIRAVKNFVITGKAKDDDENGLKVSYRFVILYPDKFRYTFNIQGPVDTHAEFASNGTTCWNVNPMFGIEEPTEMSTSEALPQKHQMDFLVPFLDKYKIQSIENKGNLREGKREYFILSVEYKDGFVADYYVDKESFLIAKRREIHRNDEGVESELIYTLSDYREVKGLKLPFTLRSNKGNLIYTIESYEINVDNLDDSIFEMPKK